MKEAERRRQAELARQAAAARAAQVAQSRELALASPYSTSSEPTVSAAPSAHGSAVVAIAMRYLGVPYVWAGASPSGFDCSGLMVYVFAQVGITLPHFAASQYGMGVPVSRDQLQPGDLVFFDGLGHMGMYVGGGNFIHAPHTGDVVKISSLSDSWYASTYVGARRI
jgi:cell wall-associated NlpC family hydrolase